MSEYETQARIMHQSNAIRDVLKELNDWETEMKQKEAKRNETTTTEFDQAFDKTHPIRSHVKPSNQPKTTVSPQPQQNVVDSSDAKTSPAADTKNTTSSSNTSGKNTPIITSNAEKAAEFKTRGNDCVKSGQYQKAIHYYTEAIRLNKFDPIFFTNRALCYLKQQKFIECIEDCTIAIRLDDKAVKAYYRRMQAHEQLNGDLDEAIRDCEAVLRLEPKNADARCSLARIQKMMMKKRACDAEHVASTSGVEQKNRLENENFVLRPASTSSAIKVAKTQSEQTPWSLLDGKTGYERIDFISKAPHLRSKQPLKRVLINDVSSEMQVSSSAGLEVCPNQNERIAPKITTVEANEHNDLAEVSDRSNNNIVDSKQKTSFELITPKTTAQFHKLWPSLKSDQDKFTVLKGIYEEDVAKLLGSQLSAKLLSEIILILKNFFAKENLAIVNLMYGIVKNPEMKIIALLMNAEDKLAFTKLIAYMRSNNEDADKVEFIEKQFERCIIISQ